MLNPLVALYVVFRIDDNGQEFPVRAFPTSTAAFAFLQTQLHALRTHFRIRRLHTSLEDLANITPVA